MRVSADWQGVGLLPNKNEGVYVSNGENRDIDHGFIRRLGVYGTGKAFKDAGHEVVTIEKEAGQQVKGKRCEVTVETDRGIDDVRPEDFDALFIPGGFSPDQLRADERFVHFTKAFMDAEKPVFANLPRPSVADLRQGARGQGCDGLYIH